MFCSTIIPTIGRPSLSRAVNSILAQGFDADDYEVVVVNDSDQPLPAAVWKESARVRIIDTHGRERCVARNSGAAIATGAYLHFLDDDDWMLPGALESFYQLSGGSEAEVLNGSTLLVDREGNPIMKLEYVLSGNSLIQLIAGEFMFLGSTLIDAAMFFSIGGFNPLVTAGEDMDLLRRIALRGSFAGMPGLVACIGIGEEDSSTDYGRLPADTRWAREGVLGEKGAFSRMRRSASNSYWQGRIFRAYTTSLVWNLRNGRFFTGASRGLFALMAMILAGHRLLSTDYWRAIARAHRGIAFSRGSRNTDIAALSAILQSSQGVEA